MYKHLGVIIILLAIAGFSKAQTKSLHYDVDWKSSEKIRIDSTEEIQRFYFNNAVYHEDLLIPHFVEKQFVGNQTIKNAKIVPVSTQILSDDAIQNVQGLEYIGEEYELTIDYSVIKKNRYVYIDIIPLRRSENGKIEALTAFEITYETQEFSIEKMSRSYASESKLKQGNWYKFRVSKTGIYEISYQEISDLGFDNPSQVGVFGYGHMVPKLNSKERYDDLPERPVYHRDNNNNGSFDSGDELLVYLEGPNSFEYNTSYQAFEHVMHNYSDYAYYFLSDQSDNVSVQSQNGDAAANVTTSTYDYYRALEKDSINIMGSGRNFYWRNFSYYLDYNFQFSIPDLVTGEEGKLLSYLAARSSVSSRFKFNLNGDTHYTQYISEVSGSYSGSYANTIDYFLTTTFNSTNSLNVEYIPTTSSGEGWLDYLTINARANLRLSDDELHFRDMSTVAEGNVTQYILSQANSNTVIWDVTDPVNLFEINPDEFSGSTLKFSAASDNLREFVALDLNADFPSPTLEGSSLLGFVENQNLHALPQTDYLIIAYEDFVPYAEQLAAVHQSLNGLSTVVVTPESIYNEFSSGTPDVSALRDFVKMFYDRAGSESEMPKYLLLFGDGTYMNRSASGVDGNYVLTYQAANSLSPSSSFVSDDFFALLDDSEGSVSGSEGLDIGVGRLPVKSQTEAEIVLNKIINYISPNSFGPWRNVMAFIGDDAEDYTSHQEQANTMADTILFNQKDYNVNKILLDAYEQVSTVQGARYPEVNQEIDEQVNKGALIVNYSGHGNEKTLAHEAVVTLSQINNWSNDKFLPLFVTATCEFAPYDDYELTSAGELILLNPDGGGIGLLTTTRLVYSTDNFRLNQEFLKQLFIRDENQKTNALGEVIMHSKNISTNSTNKRNFSLLGDPALRLAMPEYLVMTDSINGGAVEVFEDTVNAASLIRVSGHIEDRFGNIKTDFNGTLYPSVYDKMMEYSTLGNDQYDPMEYWEQKNILYSGKASVENGYFEFEFIVPVDIAYFFGNGKVSYYAKSDTKDAHGHFLDFSIGGSSDDAISDNMGPEIELYMNSTDFIDGGLTDENPVMLANVFDESGINTVGNGIGHDITVVLDENTLNAIVLNDFYEADLDSYQSGSISYPFQNLETGVHNLSLKVWDVFNNSSTADISFIVANSSELVIEHLMNYPNPLTDRTCFTFSHNHPNEEMDVEIRIYNMNGQLIDIIQENIYSSGYVVDNICWEVNNNSGGRVEPGIYVYHVEVATPNGDVVNNFEKMVVVK